MSQILTGLGIAYVIALVYSHGHRDGNQGGWSAAWRRARDRFQRKRRNDRSQ